MSPFPGHVSIVSPVDHVLSKENMDADRACADQKIAAVICSTSCISHLWYATESDPVHKNRYEASGPSMYGINYQLIVYMLLVLICSRTK